MNEKSLLQALSTLTPTPRCSVGRLIAGSSEELGVAIEQAVLDPRLPLNRVGAILSDHGSTVKITMIRKHRLGLCSCHRQAVGPTIECTDELTG